MAVDFAALKRQVTIEQVAQWLQLDLKKSGPDQLRGRCPLCNGDSPRAFVITISKDLWYSFCPDCQTGGDQLELVAKVKGMSVREAAMLVQKHFANEPTDTLDPLDYLEPDHPSVTALGFTEEVAKALGLGFAPKGTMRGRVCIPLRTEEGKLVGYIGFSPALEPQFRLPSRWKL